MPPVDNSIFATKDIGRIELCIGKMMDLRGITRNKMSSLTGVKYDIVTKYYYGDTVERIDLGTLAKFCYVLDCSIADLIQYHRPLDS